MVKINICFQRIENSIVLNVHSDTKVEPMTLKVLIVIHRERGIGRINLTDYGIRLLVKVIDISMFMIDTSM